MKYIIMCKAEFEVYLYKNYSGYCVTKFCYKRVPLFFIGMKWKGGEHTTVND